MSEEEIICKKCGKLTKKDNIYCAHCGAYLDTSKNAPIEEQKPFVTTTSPKVKKKLKTGYKVLIFFGVVFVVDLLIAYLVMLGFHLPISGYLPIVLGLFILILIIGGMIWGAARSDVIHVSDFEGCGYVIGIIIGIVIATPLYITFVLPAVIQMYAEEISDAINQMINNFFSELFEGIEIPGFEPFLFFGLFMMLSLLIIYSYHLKVKKIRK